MCPTPSTWRRPNHEEPRRSDTFRSGNGKSLWQLWLFFTRMSGLTLPSSAHLAVHLAELAFFLKILAKATCVLGSFCTSGISRVISPFSLLHQLPNLQLLFTATTQRLMPLAKSKCQFPCLVVFKKKSQNAWCLVKDLTFIMFLCFL